MPGPGGHRDLFELPPAVWGGERRFWTPVPNGWWQAAAKRSGASGYRSRSESAEHASRRPRNSFIEVWGCVSDLGGLWGKRPCEEMGQVGLRLVPNLSLGRAWSVQRYRQANGDGRSYPGLGPWRASRPDCIDGGKELARASKDLTYTTKTVGSFSCLCAQKVHLCCLVRAGNLVLCCSCFACVLLLFCSVFRLLFLVVSYLSARLLSDYESQSDPFPACVYLTCLLFSRSSHFLDYHLS